MALPFLLMLTVYFNISKTIFNYGLTNSSEKRWKGGDRAILSLVTFSVPQYLLLFKVEWQLPVESTHTLMHRKFLIAHPQKNDSMTFDYTM